APSAGSGGKANVGGGGAGGGRMQTGGTGGSDSRVDAEPPSMSADAAAMGGRGAEPPVAPGPESRDAGAPVRDTAATVRDAALPSDGPRDVASLPDAAVDRMPNPDGGVANVVNERTNLRDAIIPRWTGEGRSIAMEGETTVFKMVFNANEFGGAAGHTARVKLTPGKEYLFEYRIRFDGSFPWTKGGKIPGLAGGSAPTGCVSTDGSGFSARMMWREGGALFGYLYDNNQSSDCGNYLATNVSFTANRWHAIKQRVRLNTGRSANGVLQLWFDGRMVLNRSNVAYMNEAPANRIDMAFFQAFFGGSTSDWAPSRTCTMSFSDLFVTLVAQ
ncbi:MAG TPA: hypothetical protein VGF45_06505, partial [Polyangia bacterium]